MDPKTIRRLAWVLRHRADNGAEVSISAGSAGREWKISCRDGEFAIPAKFYLAPAVDARDWGWWKRCF